MSTAGVATMTFAAVLQKLREDAGLTQSQLAEKAGVSIGTLRGYEQGQRLPSWAAAVKLARAIGVSTEAFADCDEVAADEEPAPKKKPKGK